MTNRLNWNYVSTLPKSSGYEDVIPLLKTYSPQVFKQATKEEQEKMIDEVFTIYRKKNIFPITYYNEEGIRAEIEKCINKVVKFDGETLAIPFRQGNSLCKWFMPNMFNVMVRNNPNTQYARFYDDQGLRKAISFCFNYDRGVRPQQVQGGLRMTGSVATNFPPMRAKALYEHYTPKGGTILDFAHGFGGRLLGALTSKNDYHYIGIDPNTETHDNVQALGEAVERVTGRTDSFKLHCIGSEEYAGAPESIDFAFSSPPYFNLERYTDEETQSYNKFDELDAWLEGYVRPTIQMLHRVLKTGAYYAVNIADFQINGKKVSFVDDWVRISQEEGFTYVKDIPMKLTSRTGMKDKAKAEGVFVFMK